MRRNRYYQGPPSDHFDGRRFFNPGQADDHLGLAKLLRWRLRHAPAAWSASVPVAPARPEARVEGLRVTAVGHSTLLIQAAGRNILTDPIWSARASPFSFAGPKRVTAPGIAFDDLPPVDIVLLSHCHYDHLDVPTLRRLQAAHAPLLAMPLGCDAIVRAAVPDARCLAGDWWDRLVLADGIATRLTPALHWANRWPTDVRMSLWAGHHLATPSGTLWFAGDTGYGDGALFDKIRERLGAPDLAIIPIGAYEPRWFMAAQHVNPAEAVRLFGQVGAVHALGVHWGTFQLTEEARDAPPQALAAALAEVGVNSQRFVAAEPGGVYEFAGSNQDRGN